MPIYEYACLACRRRVSIFFRSQRLVEDDPACPRCGERRLKRRMSRVWAHSSQRQDGDFDDFDAGESSGSAWVEEHGLPGDADDFDPVEFARQARDMAAISGEPLDADFDTALRHIESGADPEDVFGEMDNAFDTATDPES